MSQSGEYALSCIPGRTRVGLVRLEPLSFGHYILLERVGCRILTQTDGAGIGDFAMLIAVCRRPWEVSERRIETASMRREIARLVRLFRWFPQYFKVCHIQLSRYLKFHLSMPSVWAKEESGKGSMCLEQSIRYNLAAKLGMSHAEIMGLPWRLAVLEAFGASEREGAIEFVTPEDKAAMERLKASEAWRNRNRKEDANAG